MWKLRVSLQFGKGYKITEKKIAKPILAFPFEDLILNHG